MLEKREIHELDFWVVELVLALESLCWSPSPKARLNASGAFNFQLLDYIGQPGAEARVMIHPVGWPKDNGISARFWQNMNSWEAFEGTITAPHISDEPVLSGFSFRCERRRGVLVFSGAGDIEENLIKERAQLRDQLELNELNKRRT